MKKIYLYALLGLGLVSIISCSGNNENQVQTFAETFAGYVNANQLDSIKSIYPTANFDSINPLTTDSIQITETDGIYRIVFGENKWIEAKQNDDGSFVVDNSKGIAAFPQDKYETALNTGMLNDSISDTKAHELLNDSTYFAWLNDIAKESYKNVLSVSAGSTKKSIDYAHDCYRITVPITITNNSNKKLGPEDYEIVYSYNQSVAVGEGSFKPKNFSKKEKGKDIGPGESIKMNLSISGNSISNPHAVLKMPMEEYVAKYYKPTGKEYQEYLDSKK